MTSKNITLAGAAVFFLAALLSYFVANVGLAAFAKSWFLPAAAIQYLCSLPMDKHTKILYGYLGSIGKRTLKSRDAILTAANENPHLIPADLLRKFNFWQSTSMFLGGALLCSIVVMAISFLKFI